MQGKKKIFWSNQRWSQWWSSLHDDEKDYIHCWWWHFHHCWNYSALFLKLVAFYRKSNSKSSQLWSWSADVDDYVHQLAALVAVIAFYFFVISYVFTAWNPTQLSLLLWLLWAFSLYFPFTQLFLLLLLLKLKLESLKLRFCVNVCLPFSPPS